MPLVRSICVILITVVLAGASPRDIAGQFHSTPWETASSHDLRLETVHELRCLALNIYWEARSEPVNGQVAVAAVTMNRVHDERFPDSICDVVYQGGQARLHRCQFSWWCDGKADDPDDQTAWQRAETLARLVYNGVSSDPTNGALWYHADYVAPAWAPSFHQTTKIGRHIFLSDTPSDQIGA